MPYIHDRITLTSLLAASATFTVALPEHAENDWLLACVSQDGGGTAVTATGWTVVGTPAAYQASRQTWLKRKAGASDTEVTFSGANEQWTVTIFAIKDADATDCIDSGGAQRGDWSGNSATSPACTTATDDCLVFYSLCMDGGSANFGWAPTIAPGELMVDASHPYNDVHHVVGHIIQQTAGAVPSKTWYAGTAGEGGNTWVVPIKNASGGSVEPEVVAGPTKLRWYGYLGDQHESISWSALSGIAASINGRTVSTTAPTVTTVNPLDTLAFGAWTQLSNTENLGAEAWVGGSHTISSTDMSGKVLSVQWIAQGGNAYAAPLGPDGVVLVLADGAGNWVAYQLAPGRADLIDYTGVYEVVNTSVIALGDGVAYDSSGTIDWSDVTKIGFGYHRLTGSPAARAVRVKQAFLHDGASATVVGGGTNSPASLLAIRRALRGLSNPDFALLQGSSQVLARLGMQVGDGSNQTVFAAAASALEIQQPRSETRSRYLWNVPEDTLGYTIYASALDSISFANSVQVTPSRQPFSIHASSSTSASYNFAGAVFVGWEVTGKAGVVFNDAIFSGCYTIIGGELDGCTVTGSLATAAVETADPSLISNCDFISGGSGHAIEITTPGTYVFSGNTFTGYGSAGTTDAAIYNNSGGAVTLNVTGGGDTPTVRNGAGASTTVNNNVTVTLTNVVVGSSYYVFKVSDSSVIGSGTAASSTVEISASASGAPFTITARVRKSTGGTRYQPFEASATLTSSGASIYVNQVADTVAA